MVTFAEMKLLNLPNFDYKVKSTNGGLQIFDMIRRKYVALTPEEWVRQHIINCLTTTLNFPQSLLSVEKTIKVNALSKRYDIVAYSNSAQPILLVECKAPDISISQKSFDQVFRYNLTLKVSHLIVTNGIQHYCGKIDFEKNKFEFLKEFPNYNEIQ